MLTVTRMMSFRVMPRLSNITSCCPSHWSQSSLGSGCDSNKPSDLISQGDCGVGCVSQSVMPGNGHSTTILSPWGPKGMTCVTYGSIVSSSSLSNLEVTLGDTYRGKGKRPSAAWDFPNLVEARSHRLPRLVVKQAWAPIIAENHLPQENGAMSAQGTLPCRQACLVVGSCASVNHQAEVNQRFLNPLRPVPMRPTCTGLPSVGTNRMGSIGGSEPARSAIHLPPFSNSRNPWVCVQHPWLPQVEVARCSDKPLPSQIVTIGLELSAFPAREGDAGLSHGHWFARLRTGGHCPPVLHLARIHFLNSRAETIAPPTALLTRAMNAPPKAH